MKKKGIMLLCSAFLIISLVIIWGVTRTEEAKIRKNLKRMESLLSKSQDEPITAGIIKTGRAAGCFTRDCEIKVNGFNIKGREELQSIIHTARQSRADIKVGFYDIDIIISDRKTTAQARLTAKAVLDGRFKGEVVAREAKLVMRKENGEWKIQNAETIEVFR
jgi:hypothetical protein